jgi:hypothetical protein
MAGTARVRKSAPPISDMAMMLPAQRDDSYHDLEHGAAMWGITTDAEAKQAIVGDANSDDGPVIGPRNSVSGSTDRPARSAFSSLCPVGFATQPGWSLVQLKAHRCEPAVDHRPSKQESLARHQRVGSRCPALRGLSPKVGSGSATAKPLATSQSTDLPSPINACGSCGRACVSSRLGPRFHLGLRRHVCLPGRVDAIAHHPSASPAPALGHCLESGIVQSTPIERATERLSLVDWAASDGTDLGLRGGSSLNLTIGDHTHSTAAEYSSPGLWKRPADVVRGYSTLQQRIALEQMATLGCGEGRPCAEGDPRRKGSAKRLFEYMVLIR